MEVLLKKGADVNLCDKEGATPLHLAVLNQHTDCVKLIVLHPNTDFTKKTKQGETALEIAKGKGFQILL